MHALVACKDLKLFTLCCIKLMTCVSFTNFKLQPKVTMTDTLFEAEQVR